MFLFKLFVSNLLYVYVSCVPVETKTSVVLIFILMTLMYSTWIFLKNGKTKKEIKLVANNLLIW